MKNHIVLPPLTTPQLEIVEGSLLGDGSLTHVRGKDWNWKFCKNQSLLDKSGIDKIDYMNWHFDSLLPYSTKMAKRISKSKPIILPTGKMINVRRDHSDLGLHYAFATHCHPTWTEMGKRWYLWQDGELVLRNGRKVKIVPFDLKLTPLLVCVWFMDDGTTCPDMAHAAFCTNGFTLEECHFLSERLKSDLSIISKVRLKRRQPIISIGRQSYFDLIDIIRPFVAWKCFRHKVDATTYKKKPQQGEDHSQAKLKKADVLHIFSMRESGMLHKDIASEMELSQACVTNILNGVTWSHLRLCKTRKMKPRVTSVQKESILRLHADGKIQRDIAAQTGVNQATVSRILARKQNG